MKYNVLHESNVNGGKCENNERNGTHAVQTSGAAPPSRHVHRIPLVQATWKGRAGCVGRLILSYDIAQLSSFVLDDPESEAGTCSLMLMNPAAAVTQAIGVRHLRKTYTPWKYRYRYSIRSCNELLDVNEWVGWG